MAAGVLLMLGLDEFTPHEHDKTGPCGPGHERCGRVWLFVLAIALHNLPEGMAIGVAFARADMAVGLPLATAIALQDLPEGLAVALALRGAGFRPSTAILAAAAGGLLEPVGALLGVGLSSGLAAAYPAGLGLAAGAMIFVVSHEVIPETHRNGHQTPATLGLMVGFALMMVLDTTLGRPYIVRISPRKRSTPSRSRSDWRASPSASCNTVRAAAPASPVVRLTDAM
ncbi:Protein GufA (fragment) [Magnetospirillum sp. SS-4]